MSESTSNHGPAASVLRTLILLRHGKSDYPSGVFDHDRPLAPRGHIEAALAGEWITRHLPPVDAVICSTALRTRETLAATGIDAQTEYLDAVYEASPGEILAEIQTVRPAVRTLLVVGHAPGMPGLATALATSDSDPAAARGVHLRFPTSAFAVLRVPAEWSDLSDTGATLSNFVIPRPTDA